MNRPSFEITFKAIKTIVNAGFSFIGVGAIIGFPGEDEGTYKESVDNYHKLFDFCYTNGTILHINPTIFVPYPGTLVYNNREKYDINSIDNNYSLYNRGKCVYQTSVLSAKRIEEMYFQLFENIIKWNCG